MRSPEMGGFAPEQKEKEKTKTEKFFDVLTSHPAFSGSLVDMRSWIQTEDLLKQKDFTSLKEIVSAIKTEFESKQWDDEKYPANIVEYIESVVDLVETWQEKE